MTWCELLIRTMLAMPFLWSALDKMLRPNTALAEIDDVWREIGIPLPDWLMLGIVICMQAVGGVLLITERYASLGAAMLLLFLLPTTFLVHQIWRPGGREKLEHFFANGAIAAGLVMIATGWQP